MMLLYVPCGSAKEAKRIVTHLVKKRLAACGHVFPVASCYEWRGKLIDGSEVVALLKTSGKQAATAEKEIRKMHSYELPCILKIQAEANKEYESWVNRQTKQV